MLIDNLINIISSSKTIGDILNQLQIPNTTRNRFRIRKFIEDNKIDDTKFKQLRVEIAQLEASFKSGKQLKNEKARLDRKNLTKVHKFVAWNAKSYDKKHNLENNLSPNDVKHLMEQAKYICSYCLADNIRLTLDRIDNNIGHIIGNVKVACVRCNYLRGNMPYIAWECLIDGLRKANKENKFGNWRNSGLNNGKQIKTESEAKINDTQITSLMEYLLKREKKQEERNIKEELKKKQEFKLKRQSKRIDKILLERMVWEKPLSKIGEELGVSGKAVEKWCKIYNITTPGRGYWAKKYAGKI